MLKHLTKELRGLVQAGDRVGVAVSGGADSIALLRAMASLKKDLGIVLTVLHFHHGIRGTEADRDEAFVAELAESLGCECVIGRGDVPAHAKHSRQSLETAGRELRYRFFESVLRSGTVATIATAHTMDDQAETVLMRMLRGAGTRGLAGIHATKDGGRYVRPLLNTRRSEVEAYLTSLGQPWREDATNREPKHFRNQVRHDLIPKLTTDFNPNIVETLARTAQQAQADEEYWSAQVAQILPLVVLPGKPARGSSSPVDEAISLRLDVLTSYPVAVQRRLLLEVARKRGLELDWEHVERLREMARGESKKVELPSAWKGLRTFRELRLEPSRDVPKSRGGYSAELQVPGETPLEEIKLLVQARLETIASGEEGYNSAHAQGELVFGDGWKGKLTVRNWKDGDRFWPGNSRGEKKVKEILQQLKVPVNERPLWPVIVADGDLIWVQGARQRPVRVLRNGRHVCRLIIEAQAML